MLPGVVPGWSHRKRESNQTPGQALQTGRNVANGSRVTRFGRRPLMLVVCSRSRHAGESCSNDVLLGNLQPLALQNTFDLRVTDQLASITQQGGVLGRNESTIFKALRHGARGLWGP